MGSNFFWRIKETIHYRDVKPVARGKKNKSAPAVPAQTDDEEKHAQAVKQAPKVEAIVPVHIETPRDRAFGQP